MVNRLMVAETPGVEDVEEFIQENSSSFEQMVESAEKRLFNPLTGNHALKRAFLCSCISSAI